MELVKVTSKKNRRYKGKVYDLQVKDVHSYTIDDLTVHNSAAGSLIAYSIGITTVDPIRFGLYFERFLNPSRISMPDVDMDISKERRDEVVIYLKKKYGEDRVANIITFFKMWSRAIIRNIAMALQIPDHAKVADRIAKKFPASASITFEDAVADSEELQEEAKNYPEIFKIAGDLSGKSKATGVHASGVIISPKPLIEYMPVFKSSKVDKFSSVTQWDMYDMEDAGFLKVDVLGLNTLDIIKRITDKIFERRGIKIDPERDIDFNDRKTLSLFARGETVGVFQLERKYVQDMCKDMRVNCFEDVFALTALIRPGTLHAGVTDLYIKRKKGEAPIKYLHPSLENAMKETLNTVLYQETAMQIAKDYAGFTMTESDNLRKAIGKKIPEKMAEAKTLFYEKSKLLGRPEKVTEEIFSQIETAQKYSFNKSVDGNTLVSVKNKGDVKIKYVKSGDIVICFDEKSKTFQETDVVNLYDHGFIKGFEVFFDGCEKSVICSSMHKFLTYKGQVPLYLILSEGLQVGVLDDKTGDIKFVNIINYKYVGERHMYDLEVRHESHNFCLSNGIVTSNSHSVSYGKIAFQTAWFKANYPVEFMCEMINGEDEKEKLSTYINEIKKIGVKLIPPSALTSGGYFEIRSDDSVEFGLSFILKVTTTSVKELIRCRPYLKSFTELLSNCDMSILSSDVMTNMINVGVFDFMGEHRDVLLAKYEFVKEKVSKYKDQQKRKSSGVKLRVEYSISEIAQEERDFEYMGEKRDLEDILNDEFALCKYFVTADPTEPFKDVIEEETNTDIYDMIDGYFPHESDLKIVAMVGEIKLHTISKAGSKNDGRNMAFLNIYDKRAEMDAILFPDTYDALKNKLKVHKVYMLTGRYKDETFMVRDMKILSSK